MVTSHSKYHVPPENTRDRPPNTSRPRRRNEAKLDVWGGVCDESGEPSGSKPLWCGWLGSRFFYLDRGISLGRPVEGVLDPRWVHLFAVVQLHMCVWMG